MTTKKIIISALLAFSLSACMSFKMTYNNLDWVLPWYLDDYLILDDAQEKVFDQHLETLLNWHRRNELPQYSEFLYEITDDLDKQQISHEKLHYYSEKTRHFYQTVIHRTLEEGSGFIAQLNDAQLSEMYEAIEANDEDFREYVAETDLEERIKERNKSVSKIFRKWIGKLSKSQKRRIQAWALESETTLEFRLEYTKASRVVLKKVMAERKNQFLTIKRLTELATIPDLLESIEYNKTNERNKKRFRQLIIDTINSLSKKQQRRLKKRILSYAGDFAELAKEDI